MAQKHRLGAQAGAGVCPLALLLAIQELPSERSCREGVGKGSSVSKALSFSTVVLHRPRGIKHGVPPHFSAQYVWQWVFVKCVLLSRVGNGKFPFLCMLLHALLFSAFQLGKWALWMYVRGVCV